MSRSWWIAASILCLSAATAAAAEPATAVAATPASSELKRTVEAVRTVGTAMFAWLTDQRDVPGTAMEPERWDWAACPTISFEEARDLLVPRYLAELPRSDGWGQPLELCLWQGSRKPGPFAGVRSPGRDGRYEGTSYAGGRFDPEEVDRDVVWMDGYFVTWPQKQP